MKEDSKMINIYIDKNKALYGAPFGPSEKYGKRPIDKLFLLMPGYSDEMLCEFVSRLFENCNTEEARDDLPPVFKRILRPNRIRKPFGILVCSSDFGRRGKVLRLPLR